ncbi:uncharacterized protein VP01_421g8 [Puccinia sorghi]|uniref:Uncharacterized protein n=1 Tax=Puccinia sorghi TaxID=27349 RepID=A0A0L6USK6_9BASI|nr:uncharacterized protein VP01_421g8 [Puccinia sorghi]
MYQYVFVPLCIRKLQYPKWLRYIFDLPQAALLIHFLNPTLIRPLIVPAMGPSSQPVRIITVNMVFVRYHLAVKAIVVKQLIRGQTPTAINKLVDENTSIHLLWQWMHLWEQNHLGVCNAALYLPRGRCGKKNRLSRDCECSALSDF